MRGLRERDDPRRRRPHVQRQAGPRRGSRAALRHATAPQGPHVPGDQAAQHVAKEHGHQLRDQPVEREQDQPARRMVRGGFLPTGDNMQDRIAGARTAKQGRAPPSRGAHRQAGAGGRGRRHGAHGQGGGVRRGQGEEERGQDVAVQQDTARRHPHPDRRPHDKDRRDETGRARKRRTQRTRSSCPTPTACSSAGPGRSRDRTTARAHSTGTRRTTAWSPRSWPARARP